MSNDPKPALPARVDNPFGSTRIAVAGAMAAAEAAVAREIAEIQGSMMIARRFPRDPVQAMDRILQACARDSVAQEAVYQYGRGGSDVAGPSIRLAEVLAQNWGNMQCGVKELGRHEGYSEVMAYTVDLETGFRDEKTFQVRHWRDTKQGGYAAKDERDIYEIIANQGARRKRACILTVIPGDVVDAAVEQCEVTLRTKLEINEEYIKSLLGAFGKYGVTKEQIEKRIQRRIDTMTPALALQLKRIFTSIKDGMSDASDWFETPSAMGSEAEPTGNAAKLGAAAKRAAGGKAKTDPKGDDKPNDQNAPPRGQGTPEKRDEIVKDMEAATDLDTLGLIADSANVYTWTAPDLGAINQTYHDRVKELS